MPDDAGEPPVLELRGVAKTFAPRASLLGRLGKRRAGVLALADIDLAVRAGEVVGIVGESGSGKSTLAQVAVRLLPPTAGTILHRGDDVTEARRTGLTAFRRDIQMVFQDTGSALNPRKTIRRVLDETFSLAGLPAGEKPAEARRLLELVGLGAAVLPRFPHQLSGGQRQRVGITRPLAMRPRLLIADEPVSALDVSLQAQIVELLLDLRRRLGLAMLFITHDLALAGQIADRVAVMFSGRIVEQGTPDEVLLRPLHPYTRALLASVPRGLSDHAIERETASDDFSPEAETAPTGCPYAPRCGHAISVCDRINPDPTEFSAGRIVRCHLVASGAALA